MYNLFDPFNIHIENKEKVGGRGVHLFVSFDTNMYMVLVQLASLFYPYL